MGRGALPWTLIALALSGGAGNDFNWAPLPGRTQTALRTKQHQELHVADPTWAPTQHPTKKLSKAAAIVASTLPSGTGSKFQLSKAQMFAMFQQEAKAQVVRQQAQQKEVMREMLINQTEAMERLEGLAATKAPTPYHGGWYEQFVGHQADEIEKHPEMEPTRVTALRSRSHNKFKNLLRKAKNTSAYHRGRYASAYRKAHPPSTPPTPKQPQDDDLGEYKVKPRGENATKDLAAKDMAELFPNKTTSTPTPGPAPSLHNELVHIPKVFRWPTPPPTNESVADKFDDGLYRLWHPKTPAPSPPTFAPSPAPTSSPTAWGDGAWVDYNMVVNDPRYMTKEPTPSPTPSLAPTWAPTSRFHTQAPSHYHHPDWTLETAADEPELFQHKEDFTDLVSGHMRIRSNMTKHHFRHPAAPIEHAQGSDKSKMHADDDDDTGTADNVAPVGTRVMAHLESKHRISGTLRPTHAPTMPPLDAAYESTLTKSSVAVLQKWLASHKMHPVPSLDDRLVLIMQANVSMRVLKMWFQQQERTPQERTPLGAYDEDRVKRDGILGRDPTFGVNFIDCEPGELKPTPGPLTDGRSLSVFFGQARDNRAGAVHQAASIVRRGSSQK